MGMRTHTGVHDVTKIVTETHQQTGGCWVRNIKVTDRHGNDFEFTFFASRENPDLSQVCLDILPDTD